MMSKTNKERYEEYEETIWAKIVFDEDSKGYVVIHIAHGKHEREGNLKIAFRLAQLGFRVELLAVSPIDLSPDATVDDTVWEFKSSLGSYSSVQNRLRDGKEQSSNILLLLPNRFTLREMLRGVISAINVDKSRKIKQIGFLFEEKEELEWIVLTRHDVLSFNFLKLTRHFGNEDT